MTLRAVIEDALASSQDSEVFIYRLEDLQLEASIGVHDFERSERQPLYVSVSVVASIPWDKSDRIEAVLDYDYVRDGLHALVKDRHFELQESLCEAALDLALAPDQVVAAMVETRKTDVYPDAGAIGCTVFRRKPASPSEPPLSHHRTDVGLRPR